jgi:YVTN family beta-propeller protein
MFGKQGVIMVGAEKRRFPRTIVRRGLFGIVLILAGAVSAAAGASGISLGVTSSGADPAALARSHGFALARAAGSTEPLAARHGTVWTLRDRAAPVTLKYSGGSGTPAYSIVEAPHHGRLEGSAPQLRYVADAGFTGFDRFRFQIADDSGSDTGTVDIKVGGSFNAFESGQVRPLALSSDGKRLYAVNTPDNRLEIFDVTSDVPVALGSVPVGMEPVAVSLRDDGEAWVVNALSDSVSIVDLSAAVPYVKRTLLVGDEPMDVVFAGSNRSRAFITTAHRGQNSPVDPAFTTPGVGRADVWVYDTAGLDAATTADVQPLTILTLFGMPARALAVSPDGGTVYAAIYKSGNQTAAIGPNELRFGAHSTANGKRGPQTDASGRKAPNTGLIVQYDGAHWRDSYGQAWDRYVRFALPDKDVFAIDATAPVPAVTASYAHVGTSLFNIAVNPQSGALYVSNLEARNLIRFEGDGHRADQPTVRGRFILNRVTVIKNGKVLPRNLDKHLDDTSPTGSADDNARSLALPLQMVVDPSGSTLYLAAFGSSQVAAYSVSQLEDDSFVPSTDAYIDVSGGGPSGLALSASGKRLYALTRFDDGVSVIDTGARKEIAHVTMYDPEPDFVVAGRRYLYDARFDSSRGDNACGSCHLFGDTDGLAWNLGNPDDSWKPNPRGYSPGISQAQATRAYHPLKGPMVTQSLRGLEFQGPEHWRGDRTGASRVDGESLEKAAFKEFGPAFVTLLGREAAPDEATLDEFADFALQLRYPPNPIRALDNSLTDSQARGEQYFTQEFTVGRGLTRRNMVPCATCHEIDPDDQRFGSTSLMSFDGGVVSQDNKIPQLRNLYQKVGMFGSSTRENGLTRYMGDQVSGFGFTHDGATDTLQTGLQNPNFHVPANQIEDMFNFLMTMPTGFAPMVGQQFTLSAATADGQGRIDLMISRALAHTQPGGPAMQECEVIVKGPVQGVAHGWLMGDDGRFTPDDPSLPTLADADLRALALAPGNALTYTCVPPGAGRRMSIDRDEDGRLDAVDTQLAGRMPTGIAPVDPNAPPEQDQPIDAEAGGFTLELKEKRRGTWPDFTHFNF